MTRRKGTTPAKPGLVPVILVDAGRAAVHLVDPTRSVSLCGLDAAGHTPLPSGSVSCGRCARLVRYAAAWRS